MVNNKKAKKHRGLKVFLSILLVILVVFGLFIIIKNMDFFNIKKINVSGNTRLKKEAIIKDAKVKIGDNIFDTNTASIKKELMKSPYIDTIKITRKLPDILNIDIKEKGELVQIESKDRKYLVLDKDGNILDILNSPTNDVTIVKGIKIDADINKKLIGKNFYTYISYDRLREFFETNGEIRVSSDFKEIVFNKNEINIVMKNNRHIEFGGLKDSRYKLKLLKKTLDYVNEEKISYEKILMNRGEDVIIVTDRNNGEED